MFCPILQCFVLAYNMYRHAVDVFDQIRKAFGVDLQTATRKYTVRMFKILWSMCLAQSYNVYRHVHKDNPARLLGQLVECKIYCCVSWFNEASNR